MSAKADEQTPLPDHPVRATAVWQIYTRGFRPAAGWFGAASVLYLGIVGHFVGRLPDVGWLIVWCGFVLVILGLTTVEKIWKVR